MNAFKSLWATVEADPKFMRRLNGWLTIFWIIMIPISLITGWVHSVTFVSALSLWALVSGHWSAWEAARVEVRQEKEQNRDIAGAIANRVIKESNLRPSQRERQKRTKKT